MANGTHQFSGQIPDRVEDVSRNQDSFNLGEPQLHLVEPGGLSRREMEANLRMSGQKVLHTPGLVSRQVVNNDVDLATCLPVGRQVGQKRHKFMAGLPVGRFPENLPRPGVQGRIQRDGSMVVILKTVPFSPARRQGQDRSQSVQSLNGRLLVHVENDRMPRRIDIQTNNVGRLGPEIRIIRGQVAFQPMRLQTCSFPAPSHHHVADAQLPGQLARALVSRAVRRRLASPGQNADLQPGRLFFDGAAPVASVRTRKPTLEKTLFSTADVAAVTSQSLTNLQVGVALIPASESNGRAERLRPTTCGCDAGFPVPVAQLQ